MLTATQIRRDFLAFFHERDHTVVPSSSLVPQNDPSLLFTNSGMVQFKDVFLGTDKRKYSRAVDAQKCIRVAGKHNDLDDVGRDDTHHTFFEMLGNWSFGDYYKEEAITWAWQLLTEVWGLQPDQLYATVFKDEKGEIETDKIAAASWSQQPYFLDGHLFFSGRKDNFWEMADTGPCGPCSEIHIDLKPNSGPVTLETLDTPRFVELWNLVFIQYDRRSPSRLDPLPSSHVDTGMGLERLASILQNVDSNYKTDLLLPLIESIQALTGHSHNTIGRNFTPYRVIADHARAAAFLIADGVMPGNTGRNYVCRMIIRRASRFGTEIGLDQPFIAEIANTAIATYADHYKELALRSDSISNTLTQEEVRFRQTIDNGLHKLSNIISTAKTEGRTDLTGPETFDLYATYGLPLEITRDVARKDHLGVDHAQYEHALELHRLASSVAATAAALDPNLADRYRLIHQHLLDTHGLPSTGVDHDPHSSLAHTAPLLAAVSPDGSEISHIASGDTVSLIVPSSPFYLEGGGQVTDTGTIVAYDNSWEFNVTAVTRPLAGLLLHHGRIIRGTPTIGDQCTTTVDSNNRTAIMRNHTATHLLHQELRNLLGDQVHQAGSLVDINRLRFDFSSNTPLTHAQISALSRSVNSAILAGYPITIGHEDYNQAIDRGATALFGEKYGDIVRTVQIGPHQSPYSLELCGGTHVTNTSHIGSFIVTHEGSISAGNRRIEAITGFAAIDYFQNSLKILSSTSAQLNAPIDQIPEKITQLLDSQAATVSANIKAQETIARHHLDEALALVTDIQGVPFLAAKVNITDRSILRKMTDWYLQKYPGGVVILASTQENHVSLIARVSSDLTPRGLHAGNLVSIVAKKVDGSGGGKPTLGQGGGKSPEYLHDALIAAKNETSNILLENN